MEISIFLKNISYQTSIQFQYLAEISHRFESGKFAKQSNENVWYGPEKTVERHLKDSPTLATLGNRVRK